jgi:hypothetical protein
MRSDLMRHNQIQAMRQTHKTFTTWMPLLTAALTISGVVLSSMERQAESGADGQQDAQLGAPFALGARVVPVISAPAGSAGSFATNVTYAALAAPRRLSLFAYLRTLVSRVLAVVFGAVVVLTVVYVFFHSDHTWRAIELTALILLVLYLAERVARARRAM